MYSQYALVNIYKYHLWSVCTIYSIHKICTWFCYMLCFVSFCFQVISRVPGGFMLPPLYPIPMLPGILHYGVVIMDSIASQITSLTIVYSTVNSDADQRKHQSSASLAFVCGIHRWPVNSPHKWPVTRKMSPFDDVSMFILAMWQ